MIKDIDMFSQALSEIKNGFFIAQCTDKLIIEKIDDNYVWDTDTLYNRAFDIRIFNTQSEVHLFRSSINNEFGQRTILSDDDAMEFKPDNYEQIINDEVVVYYDEVQFLDIDTKKTDDLNHSGFVYATGGGKYHLPLENYNDAQVIIRNYLGFEPDTGRAYVKDWRIVDFKEGK